MSINSLSGFLDIEGIVPMCLVCKERKQKTLKVITVNTLIKNIFIIITPFKELLNSSHECHVNFYLFKSLLLIAHLYELIFCSKEFEGLFQARTTHPFL